MVAPSHFMHHRAEHKEVPEVKPYSSEHQEKKHESKVGIA